MSAYAVKEARINSERKPRVNLCGDCGREIHETELLCEECESRWEPQEGEPVDDLR